MFHLAGGMQGVFQCAVVCKTEVIEFVVYGLGLLLMDLCCCFCFPLCSEMRGVGIPELGCRVVFYPECGVQVVLRWAAVGNPGVDEFVVSGLGLFVMEFCFCLCSLLYLGMRRVVTPEVSGK